MDFVPVMIDYGMCIDIIVYKFLVFVYFLNKVSDCNASEWNVIKN